MKKILVTGAMGFIGSHVVQLLKNEEYEVHGITSGRERVSLPGHVHWHTVNLLDSVQLKEMCSEIRATHLLHLAWYDNLSDRMTSVNNTEWVEATIRLAREFAAHGGKRFVMGGSCTEYDWQYGYCREDLTPTNPHTIYGESKLAVHKVLQKHFHNTSTSYANGRIFFVYGPQEAENRLVAYAIRSLLMGKEAKFSHGYQMRDYLHVADVAYALIGLLRSDVEGAVNVGSGTAVKLRDIVDLIALKLDSTDLVKYGPREKRIEYPLVVADTEKLHDVFGWKPSFELDRGICETIKWWEKEINIAAV